MEDPPKIPDVYANNGYHIQWMSNYINPGSYVTCVPGQIKFLDLFYVSSLEHWNVLEEFMVAFHKIYVSKPTKNESKPHRHCLTEGLPIAVRYKTPSSTKGWEYHRAVILKVLGIGQRKQKYRVFLIDFGDIFYASFKEIRYLKREFLDRFPAQAIECKVLLNSIYDAHQKPPYREPRVIEEFKKKTKDRILGIDFIQSDENKYKKLGKRWTVYVSIIKEGGELSEIAYEHVERSVIREVYGKYIDSDDNDDGEVDHQNAEACPSISANTDNLTSNPFTGIPRITGPSCENSSSENSSSDKGFVDENNIPDATNIPKSIEDDNFIVSDDDSLDNVD